MLVLPGLHVYSLEICWRLMDWRGLSLSFVEKPFTNP